MLVIPMGTDAPIYHWPFATVAMIVLNVALFFAVPPTSSDPMLDENDQVIEHVDTSFDRFSLALGNGLHPVQWVTHNFLHNGFIHLIGNLVFLWAFGIVVEGKLGALKFLMLYLAIGTLHGATVQTILLRSGLDSHAVGASAVVYGLLAVCMVWAPRNELSCTIILPVGYRVLVFHKEFYYTTVAMLYVGEQVIGMIWRGGLLGQFVITEAGHLSGATWGTALALLLLKLNLVDCEGWDAFTLWAKYRKLGRDWKARGERIDRQNENLRQSLRAEARTRKKATRDSGGEGPNLEERSTKATRKVMALIEKGEVEAALSAYSTSSRALPYWPSQPDLYAIIKALHAGRGHVDSVKPMRDHCQRFPAASDKMRLKLAQILIRDRQKPIAALKVLEEIPAGVLPPELEKTRMGLARQAAWMQEEGVLELEGDD